MYTYGHVGEAHGFKKAFCRATKGFGFDGAGEGSCPRAAAGGRERDRERGQSAATDRTGEGQHSPLAI